MITIEYLKQHNLILFECISGSKAYGLETESSDTDIRGIFYLPRNHFYGMSYIPQVCNETNDIVYYELGRFIELLAKNNPNILEMLAMPQHCILFRHWLMDKIEIQHFLSQLTKQTFVGYALSQVKKATGLNKKMFQATDKERKKVTDFCYILHEGKSIGLDQWLEIGNLDPKKCGLQKLKHFKDCYHLFYSEIPNQYKGITNSNEANDVSLSNIPSHKSIAGVLYFNKDAYSAHCKKYAEYRQWVQIRNRERFEANSQHGKGYDGKNLMHTMRILQMGLGIFKHRKLNVMVENREELLKIKAGAHTYEYIMNRVKELKEEITMYAQNSQLQQEPDLEYVQKLLIEIRTILYH